MRKIFIILTLSLFCFGVVSTVSAQITFTLNPFTGKQDAIGVPGTYSLDYDKVGSLTPGSVVFGGATGALHEDNSNFFFDDTNDLLKIQSATGEQLKLLYDGSNYADFETSSAGNLSLNVTGSILSSNAITYLFGQGATNPYINLYFANRADAITMIYSGDSNVNNSRFYLVGRTRTATNPFFIDGGQMGNDSQVHESYIEARDSFATASTNIIGGDLRIKAGDGASSSVGDADGGDIYLIAGIGYGTGSDGKVIINNRLGVGIDPAEKLDVRGNLLVSGANYIYLDGGISPVYRTIFRTTTSGYFDVRPGFEAFQIGFDTGNDNYLRIYNASNVQTIRLDTNGNSYLLGGNLGISTNSPRRNIDILDTINPQLRLTHTDEIIYGEIHVDSSGDLHLTNTGNQIDIGGVLVITSTGDIVFGSADSDKTYWGAGSDMSIYYDGTDANIKTNEVAASDLKITTGGITHIDGGNIRNMTTVNAATYDLVETDYILHVTYTSTGAVTSLTLPTAQTVSGRIIIIKDAGLNASTYSITIDTEGSQKIDGVDTYVMNTDGESISLYSNGTDWFIF